MRPLACGELAGRMNPQRRTHAAELRQRRRAGLALFGIRRPHIDILPILVERAGHPVLRQPQAQDADRRPNRLLRTELPQAGAGRVIHERQ